MPDTPADRGQTPGVDVELDIAGFLPEGVALGGKEDISPPGKTFGPSLLDALEADLTAVDAALVDIDASRYDGPAWARLRPPGPTNP